MLSERTRPQHRVLITTDAVGGVWRYALEMAAGFVQHGASVVLTTMGPSPSADQRADAAAIPGVEMVVTELPLDWTAASCGELSLAATSLAELAETHAVDTIHLHAPAFAGCADWPVAVVAVAHSCVGTWWQAVRGGPMPNDLAWRSGATRRGLTAADAVIVPSRSFGEALRHFHRLQRTIHVIHNGRRPLPHQSLHRECHALTVGRLWDDAKNIAALDQAARSVPYPVLAAGPLQGPNNTAISLRHARWLGILDEAALAQVYARAAVFVSVARYEPFGLAVLEAAQAGCALVLSDIPTFHELWADAALFVAPEDTDELAWTLRTILADPDRCAKLGQAAAARAKIYQAEAATALTWAVHRDLRTAALTPA
jgi:glycosyltransferase involved in cell wall biosynthesis